MSFLWLLTILVCLFLLTQTRPIARAIKSGVCGTARSWLATTIIVLIAYIYGSPLGNTPLLGPDASLDTEQQPANAAPRRATLLPTLLYSTCAADVYSKIGHDSSSLPANPKDTSGEHCYAMQFEAVNSGNIASIEMDFLSLTLIKKATGQATVAKATILADDGDNRPSSQVFFAGSGESNRPEEIVEFSGTSYRQLHAGKKYWLVVHPTPGATFLWQPSEGVGRVIEADYGPEALSHQLIGFGRLPSVRIIRSDSE